MEQKNKTGCGKWFLIIVFGSWFFKPSIDALSFLPQQWFAGLGVSILIFFFMMYGVKTQSENLKKSVEAGEDLTDYEKQSLTNEPIKMKIYIFSKLLLSWLILTITILPLTGDGKYETDLTFCMVISLVIVTLFTVFNVSLSKKKEEV